MVVAPQAAGAPTDEGHGVPDDLGCSTNGSTHRSDTTLGAVEVTELFVVF